MAGKRLHDMIMKHGRPRHLVLQPRTEAMHLASSNMFEQGAYLAKVRRERDHLAVIRLLQPLEDDRRVQAPTVC